MTGRRRGEGPLLPTKRVMKMGTRDLQRPVTIFTPLQVNPPLYKSCPSEQATRSTPIRKTPRRYRTVQQLTDTRFSSSTSLSSFCTPRPRQTTFWFESHFLLRPRSTPFHSLDVSDKTSVLVSLVKLSYSFLFRHGHRR